MKGPDLRSHIKYEPELHLFFILLLNFISCGDFKGHKSRSHSNDGEGGARIMDLDQYLEKMNTNTKII